MSERYAYYDREADIAWIPTADTERVVSEETNWGLVDHDERTGKVTALEVWNASKVLPLEMLERLPSPGRAAA
jgi:uncharacterized protein YuzE